MGTVCRWRQKHKKAGQCQVPHKAVEFHQISKGQGSSADVRVTDLSSEAWKIGKRKQDVNSAGILASV